MTPTALSEHVWKEPLGKTAWQYPFSRHCSPDAHPTIWPASEDVEVGDGEGNQSSSHPKSHAKNPRLWIDSCATAGELVPAGHIPLATTVHEEGQVREDVDEWETIEE